MASLCLSSAPVLRCASLTTLQSQVLVIPPIFELIFSTSLIFFARRSSRSRYFIVVEGCFYFALCLLDLLTHIIPAVQGSLEAFRTTDIIIGATSSLPLLCYTVFLYRLFREQLVTFLPSRFRNLFSALFLLFIPSIIALNEAASFVGISHRMMVYAGRPTLAIGFATAQDKTLWSFLTSFTLALLTVYQALNFCLAFFRLIYACLNQRRIEDTQMDEVHLFKGIVWLCVGLKLGAIESVIGFADGGFGGALSRRLLRFLSRAFLVVGIAKGIDNHEDFKQIQDEIKSKKSSRLRQLISNPRHSTFLHLSPTAAAFHGRRLGNGLPGMKAFSDFKGQGNRPERVTVHYSGGAPTLQMRFSALDMPSPALIVESVKSRPPSEWLTPTTSASRFTTTASQHPLPSLPSDLNSRGFSRRLSEPTRSYVESIRSLDSMRHLTDQFPGIPPRITRLDQRPPRNFMEWDDPYDDKRMTHESTTTSSGSLSASNSVRRKPAPTIDEEEVKRGSRRRTSSTPNLVGRKETMTRMSEDTTPTTTLFTGVASPPSLTTTPGEVMDTEMENKQDAVGVALTFDDVPASSEQPTTFEDSRRESEAPSRPPTDDLQWLHSASAMGNLHKHSSSLARIKSVGKAPRKNTPTPVKTGHTRGSIYIEPIMIPSRERAMADIQIIQGSYESTALRDSDVLGLEDLSHVRR